MLITNKEIIRNVNEGFAEDDAEKILFYMADDVTWEMVGGFSIKGKEAFRKELHNDAMEGAPVIKIKNEIAENDLVALEGEMKCKKKNGGMLDALFFDFYRLENGKIQEMRSYVIEKNKNPD